MRAASAVRRATLMIQFFAASLVLLVPGSTGPTADHGSAHSRSPHRATIRRRAAASQSLASARHHAGTPRHASTRHHVVTPDERLAAALAPVLRQQTGDLAVGVYDRATGVTATYHGREGFHTASIVKADILAVLLLRHQQDRTTLSAGEQQLATAMIQYSDNAAASDLWEDAGAAQGMQAGNAVLGLRSTYPDTFGAWGLTTTTVTDQLRLLADLTSARSPLNAASRSYELSLMRHVEDGQNWGVTAAADRGSDPAVKNGWLPDAPAGLWVINSIGVVTHDGHRLLIAVLSSGQPTEDGGISQVEAAARAAATMGR